MSAPPGDDNAETDPFWPRWTHATNPIPALRRMRLPRLRASRPALAATAAAVALALAGLAWALPAGTVPLTGKADMRTKSGLITVPGPAITRTRPGPAVLMPGPAVPGPAITRAGPGSAAAFTRSVAAVTATASGRGTPVMETVPGASGTVTATGTTTATETVPGPTQTVTATATETVPGPTQTVTATTTETVPGPTQTAPGSAPPG